MNHELGEEMEKPKPHITPPSSTISAFHLIPSFSKKSEKQTNKPFFAHSEKKIRVFE